MKQKIIKIGTNKYEVEEVEEIGNPFINFFKDRTTIGQIGLPYSVANKTIKKILIKKSESKKAKEKILYHEIAHGICYELSKKYKEFDKWNNNEKFIDYFASKLMTCFDIKEYKK